MADDWTKFPPVPAPVPSVRGREPFLIGIMGPPGAGKTRSMLRMMRGVQRVFQGPLVLIDTEAGRSRKYSPRPGEAPQPDHPLEPTYEFERIDLEPPFRGDRCWAAIKKGLERQPAALGFDNLSDEHSGEGGYLWWHDEEVPKVGGNEWAAWAKPSAARKRLLSGISHVAAPPILFFTFISEEKTDQVVEGGKKKIINKGWTPVAPLLILKTLDLTCILPWDSKGTPIWESRKLPYEDFTRKWPDHLKAVMKPGQITEEHGEALARWAAGGPPNPSPQGDRPTTGQPEARKLILDEIGGLLTRFVGDDRARRSMELELAFGTPDRIAVSKMNAEELANGLTALRNNLEAGERMREREPGEDLEEKLL